MLPLNSIIGPVYPNIGKASHDLPHPTKSSVVLVIKVIFLDVHLHANSSKITPLLLEIPGIKE